MKETNSTYGALLRTRRIAAGLSLRDVASKLGVSHVYLADVERGVRGPLKPEHEPALLAAVPGLTHDELARARAVTRPVKITLENTPPKYQDLTLAFARRIEKQDLSDSQTMMLLQLLNNPGKD
jgi:transcriptional regulator with XRE-family HTH domain